MTVDWAIILSALGIIGGGTGIAAIIVAITSRKKTKADATKIISEAAGEQVKRLEAEALRWQHECHDLRADVEELKGKAEKTHSCQTLLTEQIEQLQEEKRKFIKRIEVLEDENARLKAERDKN
jgi:peptidoglycan hydrolase CwlO-like protein